MSLLPCPPPSRLRHVFTLWRCQAAAHHEQREVDEYMLEQVRAARKVQVSDGQREAGQGGGGRVGPGERAGWPGWASACLCKAHALYCRA